MRGAVAAALGGCCWALLVMGPDADAVKTSVQDAQDSVLRYFVSCAVLSLCGGALLIFVLWLALWLSG